MSRFAFKSLAVLSLSAVLLTGCVQNVPYMKQESAQRTALPVFMIPRTVPADPFTLQAYERVHEKFSSAVLYIEGDGPAPGGLTLTPAPADPIGLRLAAQDPSKNVIYLARPCQYRNSKYQGKDACPKIFTGDAKFSEAVIQSYEHALDNIKAYYNITSFDVVGYDGGAAIATILAARRADISTLRTVAGNLDTKTTNYLNKKPDLTKSYNPIDYASQLVNKPQRHFIGKLDKVTPPAVYNSYAQALGPAPCNSVSLIDNADHESGWVEQWKTLSTLPVSCTQPVEAAEPAPVPFDPDTLDTHTGVDHGQK